MKRWISGVAEPLLILVASSCLTPQGASGQMEDPVALGLTVAFVDMETLAASEPLAGILYGVEASSAFSRIRFSAAYRQGWLESKAPDVQGRDVTSVQGALALRVRPWLALEGGPNLSIIALSDDDRHVLRWRVGARGHAPLVAGVLSGYATVAASVAGTGIHGVEIPRDGGAGEVGLLIEPNGALWARLGYRYEREYLDLGWSQTLQAAFLIFGMNMPRTKPGEPRP